MVLLDEWHIQLHIPNDLPDEAMARLLVAFTEEVRAAATDMAPRLTASTDSGPMEVRVEQ